MRSSFEKGLAPGLALLILLLIADGYLAYRNTQRVREHGGRVAHTHEVLDATANLLATLTEAEAGLRSYLLTDDEDYLRIYITTTAALDQRIERIQTLTADNPQQQARIPRLRELVQARAAFMAGTIVVHREKGIEAVQERVATGEGKRATQNIRALLTEMEDHERELLRDRERATDRAYVVAVGTSATAATAGVIGLLAFGLAFGRHLRTRHRIEGELQKAHNKLNTVLDNMTDAIATFDRDWRYTYVNPAGARMGRTTPEAVTGQVVWEAFPHLVGTIVEREFRRCVRENVPVRFEVYVEALDAWFENRCFPTLEGMAQYCTDITDRKQSELERERHAKERAEAHRRLEEAYAVLDTLMTQAPVGLAFVDRNLRIVRINKMLAAISGGPEAAFPGRAVADLIPDLWPDVEPQYRAVLDRGEAIRNHRLAGPSPATPREEREWLVSYYPVQVPDDGVVGVGVVVVDVTSEARLARLEAADQAKDEFLITLAHELKNPLAPIRTIAQSLAMRGTADASVRDAYALIDRQVDQLVRLIDDLLDIGRITQGKLTLHREAVDLLALAATAIEASRPHIDARRHELTVDLPPAPVRVDGDPVRLVQIVTNLLNNAAKYTPDGGHIRLTVRPESDRAVIRVQDNGLGIPADMLTRVFGLFTQVEETLSHAAGGLGIGLSLVRRLVTMHGGTVEAFSGGPGWGSEFVVTLPLLTGEPARPEPTPTLPSGPNNAPTARRILVVDDNTEFAEAISDLLTNHTGSEVRVAGDGRQAVDLASEFRPEVVLLDLSLPDLTGYEVASRIRDIPALAGTVLVALTGSGGLDEERRTREAGFDTHLVKPVKLRQVEAVLARLSSGAPDQNVEPASVWKDPIS